VQNVVSVLKTINVEALLQVEEEQQQQQAAAAAAAVARSLKRNREQFEPLSDRVEASARQGPSS
jgi:ElaB/YqjD/DUF883 family membrane-anchored ribosome-binding protein